MQVLGSAIHAFSAVCGERLELLHPHYRRLTSLMCDVDEWGQIVIVNTLLRYARTQFLNPQESKDTKRTRTMTEDSEDDSGACPVLSCPVLSCPVLCAAVHTIGMVLFWPPV
jgi:AP-3 complex subunit beta